jgi:hypothetical protein
MHKVCTFEERRITSWWKMGIWRQKGIKGNTGKGTCPLSRKKEGWSHIPQCSSSSSQALQPLMGFGLLDNASPSLSVSCHAPPPSHSHNSQVRCLAIHPSLLRSSFFFSWSAVSLSAFFWASEILAYTL